MTMLLIKGMDYTVVQILKTKDMKPHYVKTKNVSYWLPVKKNKIGVTELKPSKIPVTFRESLRVTLIIGQIFALLPVNGAISSKSSDVKFVWMSWKCAYFLLSLSGQFFMTIMCVYLLANTDTTLDRTTPLIFYSTACVTMLMFLKVARMWPALTDHITRVEEIDQNYDKKLSLKCNITCAVVLISAALEHILSLLSAFAGAMACYSTKPLYEAFIIQFYPWVFKFLPFSGLLGAFTQFFHFQATFIWNFSDLFVISMSYYLTSRLQHVNKKLQAAQGKYLPETFWRTIREDYGRAVTLVRKVDEVISGIIFISFANNLFFICLQLFNTLDEGFKGNVNCNSKSKGTNILGGYEATIYYLFSLFFLMARSVAVSLIASEVNMASTVPATVLYDVPSPVYCIEVQRFLDQVNGEKVALSGLQFFSVTRGLLLTVAGTIVTYELVMLQFSAPQQSHALTTTAMISEYITTTALTNTTII